MKKKQILITTVRYLLQAHTVVVSGVFLVDLMGVAEIVVVVVYYVCVCVCVCVCECVCESPTSLRHTTKHNTRVFSLRTRMGTRT